MQLEQAPASFDARRSNDSSGTFDFKATETGLLVDDDVMQSCFELLLAARLDGSTL